MITDILLLLVLFLLNGVFAMSEIAVVSSRRARLVQMAESSAGARRALALAAEPTRFLSSVQVGITGIGILSGAIGEAAIADRLRLVLEQSPALAPFAEALALGIMVVLLTYFSLILGELVPKRLALMHPERVASVIAAPMEILARVGRPLVRLLSLSTDSILRLIGVRQTKQPAVTMDEVRVMLAQGAAEGVFERSEHEMVSNVLDLDDRHVGAVLTPRLEVVFLDVRDSIDVNRTKMRQGPHSVLPLCDGGWDHVLGFIRSTRLLDHLLAGQTIDLKALSEPPLFVPETMTLMKLLEQFKRTHLPVALVVDEFGGVDGLVSLADVVDSIVGELPSEPQPASTKSSLICSTNHAGQLFKWALTSHIPRAFAGLQPRLWFDLRVGCPEGSGTHTRRDEIRNNVHHRERDDEPTPAVVTRAIAREGTLRATSRPPPFPRSQRFVYRRSDHAAR